MPAPTEQPRAWLRKATPFDLLDRLLGALVVLDAKLGAVRVAEIELGEVAVQVLL
jgi:hypothetical protein